MDSAVIFKLSSDSVLAFRLIHFFLMTILICFLPWLIFHVFSTDRRLKYFKNQDTSDYVY